MPYVVENTLNNFLALEWLIRKMDWLILYDLILYAFYSDNKIQKQYAHVVLIALKDADLDLLENLNIALS